MAMSSIIELYLTAYGWKIYGLFYLALSMTKIILLPFIRFGINAVIEAWVSSNQHADDSKALKGTFAGFIGMAIIFILSVPPYSKLDMATSAIQSPGCGKVNIPQSNQNDLASRFGAGVRVPILPHLVIALGSGINSAVLSSLPCAEDLLESNRVANGFMLSPYGDAENLRSEMQDFGKQCYSKAKGLAEQWNNSTDPKVKEVFRQLSRKYFKKGTGSIYGTQYGNNTDYVGSEFMEKVFYSYDAQVSFTPCEGKLAIYCNNSTLSSSQLSSTWSDMRLDLPLRIKTPYTSQVNANCKDQLSVNETASGIGCINCGQYWRGNNVSGSGYDGIIHRIAVNFFLGEVPKAVSATLNGKSPKVAYYNQNIDPEAFEADPEGYVDRIVRSLPQDVIRDIAANVYSNVQANPNAESIVGGKGAMAATGFAIATVVDGIATGGKSTLSSIKNAAGMAMVLLLTKDALKLFLPMVMMLVYAFWLVFMIIGDFSGKTLWKGLLMIFLLKMIPLGWGIADLVGSEIMALLYPEVTGWGWMLKQLDRVVVMIAMVFFYLSVPTIMMYIFANADAPSMNSITNIMGDDSKKTISGGGQVIKRQK